MRFTDFEALVRRLALEVPAEFLDGVEGVEVSPKVLPHPVRAEIYTLGECIPLPAEGEGDGQVRSRVVLYHGSFQALAALQDDFDWREETWETLTHELRHHLEWRARVPDLEAFDWAAEQNFARGEGEPFDPDFAFSAEKVAPGVFRLDDDYFLDLPLRGLPRRVGFGWHGAAYEVDLPAGAWLPALLVVEGVVAPPPGELVLLLHRPPRLLDLFRRRGPAFQAGVVARATADAGRLSSPGGNTV